MDKRRRRETKKGRNDMRGTLGGLLVGGLVSALGLSTVSLVNEQPIGVTPPDAPLVDAPQVGAVDPVTETVGEGPSSPVGSISIDEPQAPDFPEAEGGAQDLEAPQVITSEASAPRADTDPPDAPEVVSIEGAMEAPETSEGVAFAADPVEPVLPNPQGQAPQTPNTEADLTVSTAPARVVPEPAPHLQLQGGDNSLLADRDTGVTIRRPVSEAANSDDGGAGANAATNALVEYAADSGDFESRPLLSIVLIDDGSMSAAAAALAGLPFGVTIALDPTMENAADLMARYRADGFEVVALAKLPEGAQPGDVETTFESVFGTLPESIGVLDAGDGGLQSDHAVTEQAMDILASQGRGFVNAGQGLNMAGRAAESAGVPAAVIYRDLDSDGQDARVVRRFIDQAAFRARQDSGVVLVGRVRPDTISALILWGTANQDDRVAVVPVSAVLLAQ